LLVWRLVVEKVVSYGDLQNLSYIDALKISAILDYRLHLEKEQREKEKADLENQRNNHGNQS